MVEATQIKAGELGEFLNSRDVSVWLCSAWDKDKARAQLNDTDLILTVGGDGTILRAAQVVIPGTTPITGINLGKLGFMTELNADEALEKLPALLDKEGWLDERAMLQVELANSGQAPCLFHALYHEVFNVLQRRHVEEQMVARAGLSSEFLDKPLVLLLDSLGQFVRDGHRLEDVAIFVFKPLESFVPAAILILLAAVAPTRIVAPRFLAGLVSGPL